MLTRYTRCIRSLLIVLLATLGAAPALAQEWAERGGGTSSDGANDVAVDADGNSYVVGYFAGTASFGSGAEEVTLTSAGSTDGFLAKYDPSGTLLWIEQIEGSGTSPGIGVAVDGSGNVYAAGYFAGMITLGTGAGEVMLTSSGSSDVFLAKYAADGTLSWAKRAGGSGQDLVGGFAFPHDPSADAGDGLAVDASGNAYLTGFFQGAATFGSGTDVVTLGDAGGGDLFLAKYATDGSLAWAQRAGGDRLDDGRDLALDADGDVHLTGIVRGTATFGSGANQVTIDGSFAAENVLAEYAPDGTLLGVTEAGDDTDGAKVTAIAVDGSGNAYLTGFFENVDITLGTGAAATTLTNQGNEDLFLAKYDASGTLLWAQGVGGSDSGAGIGIASLAIGLDVATDASGNVWATGEFTGTATFGSGASTRTLSDTGPPDAYVVRLDPSGAVLEAQKIGGPDAGSIVGHGIAAGITAGSAVVVGGFGGTATFDGNAGRTLTSAGVGDAFAARYVAPLALADLRVEATVDDPNPAEGDEVTFTVTLINDGPDDATQVQVVDEVPGGLSGAVVTPSQGTYDDGTGVWAVGTLRDGSSATLTLTGTTTQSSPITNTATVTHSDQADPDAGTNTDSATSTPSLPPGSSLVVTNTNSTGVGSLRNAIEFANATPNGGAPDVVTFAIDATTDPGCDAGSGVCTIRPASPLPAVTEPAVIDGLTQHGADCSAWPATLQIVLDGSGVSSGNNGFTLSAEGSTVRGLVIQGFKGYFDSAAGQTLGGNGVFIDSDDNTVACNFFSTDVTGMLGGYARENEHGVQVRNGANNTIGGTSVSERNLISNSDDSGVFIKGLSATGNVVAGNFIGTDAAGTAALGNGSAGVHFVDAPDNTIGGADHDAGVCNNSCNLIAGNDGESIEVAGLGTVRTTIQGNFIGTDITGTVLIPSRAIEIDDAGGDHTIGGLSDPGVCSGACNLIGTLLDIDDSDGSTIQGNFIGTDITGTAAIGRGGLTIDGDNHTIGGSAPGLGNLISGNNGNGLSLSSSDASTIQGNLIGVAIDGISPLGNSRHGVSVSGSGNLIGGLGAGEGNTIAFNGRAGVVISGGCCPGPENNAILGNTIFSNGDLGIDLGGTGVNGNDPGDGDGGPNNLQNFPVLDDVPTTTGAGMAPVSGSLDSAPSTAFRLEFFANETCDPGHFGEGQAFLGATDVTTNAAGEATFSETFNTSGVPQGWFVTATATRLDGGDPAETSEFSPCDVLPGSPVVTNTNDDGPGSLRAAILFANANAGADVISFAIDAATDPGCNAGTGVCTIQPASQLPDVTSAATIDGVTQAGADCASWPPSLKIVLPGYGLTIRGDGVTVRGLVMASLQLSGDNNSATCNFIGTDITGTVALSAGGFNVSGSGSTIGGTTEQVRNLISGNVTQGLTIAGDHHTVQGNFIGTDVTGQSALGNGFWGIRIAGGSNNTIGGSTGTTPGGPCTGACNLVSGNGRHGIHLDVVGTVPTGNVVQGNFIGTDAAGTGALGNGMAGLFVTGSANVIGGTGSGEGNTIAHNGESGVALGASAGTGNAILGNRIYQNTLLGIDLAANGATANDVGDGDTGANNLQNVPELTAAAGSGSTLTIDYRVDSGAASAAYPIRVAFFRADADDEEGRTFLGADSYEAADAQSTKQALFTPATPVVDGDRIVATATDDTGNTSEFSAAATVSGAVLPVELVSFTVTMDAEAAALSWHTASETNNAGFEVQRAVPDDGPGTAGQKWQTVAFVEGRGTTTEAQRYAFRDADVPFEADALRYRLRQVDYDGAFTYSPEVEVSLALPQDFTLHGAYPNPFNPQTTIRYELPQAVPVRLAVYDPLGREVALLIDGVQEAGRHEVVWDAARLATGTYFYRVQAGNDVQVRQVVLIK